PVGEISPRDSGAVPVDDALYNAAAITKRAAFTALIRWQKWFNSLPLCVRELRKSRPLSHTSIMLEHRPTIRIHVLVLLRRRHRRSRERGVVPHHHVWALQVLTRSHVLLQLPGCRQAGGECETAGILGVLNDEDLLASELIGRARNPGDGYPHVVPG